MTQLFVSEGLEGQHSLEKKVAWSINIKPFPPSRIQDTHFAPSSLFK
jgi:hypothetical protein